MSDVADWAYLAGLIDGEGCISATSRDHHAQVVVGSTNLEMLTWIQGKFGGRLNNADSTQRKAKGWKPYYHWRLTRATDVARTLNGVIPYLTIKLMQAQLAVELTKRPSKKEQYGIYRLLQELKKI